MEHVSGIISSFRCNQSMGKARCQILLIVCIRLLPVIEPQRVSAKVRKAMRHVQFSQQLFATFCDAACTIAVP
eukprot:15470763-Alexandrium_andersonii.AAC.1